MAMATGAGVRLSIMQSNGGSISAARAKQAAVQTILSGPAAGAVGAHAVAVAAGYPRIIGFDMGGTSTDVTLIDGTIGVTTESTVGDFPVRLPIIDIHTVGAGGGSIAYIDAGGALRVGPRSAGADPGPVCYGKGTELTVTDANLLLGRLDAAYFLGGRMTLDEARARAHAKAFAARVGIPETALAEGIVRVANANMERAIRVVSVQRGFDPRDFALLAFGGAGGMHACEIADTLDIATVIAPRYAGVLSALGMLLADVTKDYSLTVLRRAADVTHEELRERFAPLMARAQADLAAEGFTGDRALIECALDVRYIGQSYEITVPFEEDLSRDVRRASSANLRLREPTARRRSRQPARQGHRRDEEASAARVKTTPLPLRAPRPRAIGAPHRTFWRQVDIDGRLPPRRSPRRHGSRRPRADRRTGSDDGDHAGLQIPRRRSRKHHRHATRGMRAKGARGWPHAVRVLALLAVAALPGSAQKVQPLSLGPGRGAGERVRALSARQQQ